MHIKYFHILFFSKKKNLMTKHIGNLHKMATTLANPVQYNLKLQEDIISINAMIGKNIYITFQNVINCKRCGRKTSKSFAQGFCFPCFKNAPENAPCIIHPEKCEGHLGKGRDPEWEQKHHVQDHIVYLAVSSGLKVGVTRSTQVPTRWIDQGAWKAIALAKTPNRYLAGSIEVALKEHVSDKTQWQKMLKNEIPEGIDLAAEKEKMHALLPTDLQMYYAKNNDVTEINYPVLQYPTKVKSLTLDKTPTIQNTLVGIKGQYLLFEDGSAFNVRRHTGYLVEIKIGETANLTEQGSLF